MRVRLESVVQFKIPRPFRVAIFSRTLALRRAIILFWVCVSGIAFIALALLTTGVAIAQENAIEETLVPQDESLNWRLEVRKTPDCIICDAIIQIALNQNSQTPTQCSLLDPPLPAGFELPTWSVLDYRQNLELLKRAVYQTEASNSGGAGFLRKLTPNATPEEIRAAFWDRFSEPILALFERGDARLETANFSIAGKHETLFRINQIEPVRDTYDGDWRTTTCDQNGKYPSHYVFATESELEQVLSHYARTGMTILNYRDATYLWRRASTGGAVLALARSGNNDLSKTVLSFSYWLSRAK